MHRRRVPSMGRSAEMFAREASDPPPEPRDEENTAADDRRHIRSFLLRQGRFTPAQQRAFGEFWARYGLDPHVPLDATRVFARVAPLVLEIGFGNGEQLLWSGPNEPQR